MANIYGVFATVWCDLKQPPHRALNCVYLLLCPLPSQAKETREMRTGAGWLALLAGQAPSVSSAQEGHVLGDLTHFVWHLGGLSIWVRTVCGV